MRKHEKSIVIALITVLLLMLVGTMVVVMIKFNAKSKKEQPKVTEPPIVNEKLESNSFSSEPIHSVKQPNTKGYSKEEKTVIYYTSRAMNFDEFDFKKPVKGKDGFYEVKLVDRKTSESTSVFRINLKTGEQELVMRKSQSTEKCPECKK